MTITPPQPALATTTREITTGGLKRTAKRRVDPVYFWILAPTVAVFMLVIVVPAVIGFGYSLTNSIGFGDVEFIGLRNYIAVFRDEGVLASYGFTLGFALVTVIVVNVLALLLALGLTARIRFTSALRTVFVIPMVISGLVIAFVFKFLFANSVPLLGQAIGSQTLSTSLLANPDLAWVAVVIVTAWQSIPGTMLIYIAGLLTVPGDVYEAASIDGADGLRRFWNITLPLIAGYVVINTILGFKGFINAYDIIVGLTGGGPGVATRSVAMTIFKGFDGGDYAYQMANAMIFFLISVAIALIQLRVTRGRGGITS